MCNAKNSIGQQASTWILGVLRHSLTMNLYEGMWPLQASKEDWNNLLDVLYLHIFTILYALNGT